MKALLLTVALFLLGLAAALGDDLLRSERKLLAEAACPDGYYYDKKAGKCKPCKVLNCKRCKGKRGQKCVQCMPDYELSGNNRCPKVGHQTFCPPGQWLDARIDECRDCKTKNCEDCVAGEGRKCRKCFEGYKLTKKNTCVEIGDPPTTCPEGKYYDTKAGKCLPCEVLNCAQCSGKKGQKCDKCLNGFTLSGNNRCPRDDNDCPQGTWLDARIDECVPCKTKHCLDCVAGEGRKCRICEDHYELVKNKCIPY